MRELFCWVCCASRLIRIVAPQSSSLRVYDLCQMSTSLSLVWDHFTRQGDKATCNRCGTSISVRGSSTTGLHTHLKSKHSVTVTKRSMKSTVIDSEDNEEGNDKDGPEAKKRKITHFFKPKIDNSVDATLARMTAKDGLPFSVFVTSNDLISCMKAKGYSLPSSATTVRNKVMNYAKTVEDGIREDIFERKSNGERFSLTVDEWTSSSNLRFLNVNVHCCNEGCLLYTSPSPRDLSTSRMPSSA